MKRQIEKRKVNSAKVSGTKRCDNYAKRSGMKNRKVPAFNKREFL